MSNYIRCYNQACGQILERPAKEFTKCSTCYTDFFVFCHEFPFKLFQHNKCNKCTNELYYFFCFKCNEVMCYNKYRMGSVSKCKNCGFKGCYVVCSHCHKPECFPPTQRYEGITWKCEFCQKPFNFMTCDQCYYEFYQPSFKEGQTYVCRNLKCRATLRVKKCTNCNFIFIDSKNKNQCEPCADSNTQSNMQPNIQSNMQSMFSGHAPAANPMQNSYLSVNSILPTVPFNPKATLISPTIPIVPPNYSMAHNIPIVPNQSQYYPGQSTSQNQFMPMNPPMRGSKTIVGSNIPQQANNNIMPNTRGTLPLAKQPASTSEDAICKICLDREASYVNTKCFHMSSCSRCVKSLKQICPICRATGEFRKVYK